MERRHRFWLLLKRDICGNDELACLWEATIQIIIVKNVVRFFFLDKNLTKIRLILAYTFNC